VPATTFETAGNELSVADVEALLKRPEIKYVSEMMNWPGVLNQDPDVVAKIELAKKYGKPVDGHAPGLRGDQAKAYVQAGMSTDHECFTAEEALDKLAVGMNIQIREGSAAKNFNALVQLIDQYPSKMMFCSDDKHPDDLEVGHINQLEARAVAAGQDLFNVLQVACINPVNHYKLEVGQLKVGDAADFIEVEDLKDFKVRSTWVDGRKVCKEGEGLIKSVPVKAVNKFAISPITNNDIAISGEHPQVNAIEVLDGELVTNKVLTEALLVNGKLESNTATDTLKIVVVNRYNEAPPAVGFIKNMGFQKGAIASSVAHDSHNIIAVGVSDEDITSAINMVINQQGGLSAVGPNNQMGIALPVAGLMSTQPAEEVAKAYAEISAFAKSLGSTLHAPYMSLSFMALLVIPSLKLSDLGLFDGDSFQFTEVQA
jgi:adenine deaminase